MIKNKRILIVGAGGFIGGHLVNHLLKNGNSIIATDIKPKEYWFQDFDTVENHYSMDMKEINNCRKVTKNIHYVFNMACNMGGMGFIENNKAECMQSVLISLTQIYSLRAKKTELKIFFHQALVHTISQNSRKYSLKDLKKTMPILRTQRTFMDGKNYLVNGCVDILWKIME